MKSILLSVDQREDLVFNVITEFQTQCKKYSTSSTLTKGGIYVKKFSDGELIVDIKDSVRGARVYIMTSPNSSDKIMALNLAIDAVRRASAKEIIVILPYFPYARQDKKDRARAPIGAKVIAEMIENRGADAVVTFELHADQIQGFFKIPLTHIEGRYLFAHHIAEMVKEDKSGKEWVLCAPDAGASKRVKYLRDLLKEKFAIQMGYVVIDKTRVKANEIDDMVLIGNVAEKHVILVDDIVDTAGTLCKAADLIIDEGGASVRAIATHGVLSGKAYYNIGNSKLEKLIVSDSLNYDLASFTSMEHDINLDEQRGKEKIEVVSVSKHIAKALIAINNNYSIEDLKGKG
jgi:ribose-phosphate pyrophosphokinase